MSLISFFVEFYDKLLTLGIYYVS